MTDHALATPEKALGWRDWVRTSAPFVFGGAMLLSATLVFSLQPMFAKMVLPRVGGGAAAWTVALVFFQGALLVGYFYAHLLSTRLPFKAQVATHMAVLAIAGLMFLPIAVAPGFAEPPAAGQGLWLMALFTASVGLPFAAISATAPLLQSWYARTARADAGDPYYLYGASNAGSFVALLAFPLLIEPALGAHAQSLAWTFGFAGLGAAILGCALIVSRSAARSAAVQAAADLVSWKQRLSWAALGLAPSALLVSATTHITTDVVSAPLLWVIPLAIYLSAFIVAFSPRPWVSPRIAAIAFPLLAAASLCVGWSAGDWRVVIGLTLMTLWSGCFVCCRALYDARPATGELTGFYLWMSLGGVIGGALTALLAPVIFNSVLEWHLSVVLCLLALPLRGALARPMLAIYGLCVALTVLAAGATLLGVVNPTLIAASLGAGFCAIVIARSNRALMAGAGAALVLTGASAQGVGVLFAERSFYGAVRVLDTEDHAWRIFMHGTTLHGVQSLSPEGSRIPAGYYGPLTPVGQAMRKLNDAGGVNNVAMLGLGAGAMACYARPGQSWSFFEIDPLVVRVARDPTLFTYLSQCTPDAPMIVGDARLELAKQKSGAYDVLFADVFSSDAVPTHLITREAMTLYLDRVSPKGVVLIHVTNRNLALADVAARAAMAAGAVVLHQRYTPAEQSFANVRAEVIAIARTNEALAPLSTDPAWQVANPPPGRVWTDDYSSVLEPLLRRLDSGK